MTRWQNHRMRMAGLAAALVLPTLTSAQGCALCYTQAAGSGSRVIEALKSGILILVVPPMLICLGITWMAYKKRNEFNEDVPGDACEREPLRRGLHDSSDFEGGVNSNV